MTDLRHALRLLGKSRLFTITVILIVAVGIGATTAIFSVVHAVLLRPLPFEQPDRLMQVAEKNDALRLPAFGASALNYLSWKEQTRTFEHLGAIQFGTFTLSGHGDPETYTGTRSRRRFCRCLDCGRSSDARSSRGTTRLAPRPWRSSATCSGGAASAEIRTRSAGRRS